MALARKEITITDARGNVVSGATVTVRRETVGTPLEPLYSDRDGLTPISNPIVTGSDGVAAWHCAGGAFQIEATFGSESRTMRYVGIGLAGEIDNGALALGNDASDVPFTPTGDIAATDVQAAAEELDDEKEPLDADILRADTSDDLAAGFTATSADQGTKSSGTFTPTFATRNIQHCVNNGAFTLGVPTGHGSLVLDITNDSSAGAITTSAYDLVTGDSFTTTNGHKFRCFITTGNAGSHLHVVAFQ